MALCRCSDYLFGTLYTIPFLLPFFGGNFLTLHSSLIYFCQYSVIFLYLMFVIGYICCSFCPQIDRTGRIPMLKFRDRESYVRNKTKEYDDIAMKYLSYVLFFLAICFSIYSLKYERHKSWYSWILSSLTSCVYMFGKYSTITINLTFRSYNRLVW